jgi:hypothetical protein
MHTFTVKQVVKKDLIFLLSISNFFSVTCHNAPHTFYLVIYKHLSIEIIFVTHTKEIKFGKNLLICKSTLLSGNECSIEYEM